MQDLAKGEWEKSGWTKSTIEFIPETGVYKKEKLWNKLQKQKY